jgi:ACR3 family arsenite efflux pump ArsB
LESVRTYLVMSATVDAAWWPVISVLGALIIIPLVLGLATAVRSFVLFRRSIGPSQH